MEKTPLLGVEEACTHKYEEARSDTKLYVFFCFHHLADVIVEGMSWYIFSSASTLVSMDSVLCSVLVLFIDCNTNNQSARLRRVKEVLIMLWTSHPLSLFIYFHYESQTLHNGLLLSVDFIFNSLSAEQNWGDFMEGGGNGENYLRHTKEHFKNTQINNHKNFC